MDWFFKSHQTAKKVGLTEPRFATRHKLRFLLVFYIALPATFALLSGLSATGSQPLRDPHYYLIYWMCTTIPAWMIAGLGTTAVSFVLRRFDVSLLLVLCLGHLVSMNLVWMPLSGIRNDILSDLALPGQQLRHAWDHSSPLVMLYQIINGLSVWVLCNYAAAVIFKVPRFGHVIEAGRLQNGLNTARQFLETPRPDLAAQASPAELAQKQAADELAKRIAPQALSSIVSMQAEDHYTRVQFAGSDSLIYMPFSKAALGASTLRGLKTHRSYWVRIASIKRAVREGGKPFVELENGQKVPVSRNKKTAIDGMLKAAAAR